MWTVTVPHASIDQESQTRRKWPLWLNIDQRSPGSADVRFHLIPAVPFWKRSCYIRLECLENSAEI
jgi:hypothetical protein